MKAIKNTIIYYYLYKFRKKILLIFGIILFDIIISFFISDLSEVYDKKTLIFIKWGIYILSFVVIYFIIKSKKEKKTSKIETSQKDKKEEVIEYSSKEKEILKKPKLKSKADLIIEKYKKR